MRHIPLLTLIMIILIGCASETALKEIDYEDTFQKGQIALNKKRYIKAQELFNTVVIGASHTDLGDDALYFLGESYFRNKEYILASADFDKLIRRMPFSPFVERARYRICQSYLAESPKYYHDQTYTDKALSKYQEFLDDYPQSEHRMEAQETIQKLRNKLAKKAFETGVLYIKLHEFKSAKLAFSQITEYYYDTDYIDQAHFEIIHCHLELGEVVEARTYYDKTRMFIQKVGKAELVETWLEEGRYSEKIQLK